MFGRKGGLRDKESFDSPDNENSDISLDHLSSSDNIHIHTLLEKGTGSDPSEAKIYNFNFFNYQIKIFAGLGVFLLGLFFFMDAIFLLFTYSTQGSINSINIFISVAFFSLVSVISVYFIRKQQWIFGKKFLK
jgi:hypothetical protein